jgi:MFS transporter, MFS domain-containing protein family, molybdate-anion transporter
MALIAFIVPVMYSEHVIAFFAFNLFELCCGFYFPTAGVLRSRYIPEEARATIMNLFRVPLNLIVVVVLTKVCI